MANEFGRLRKRSFQQLLTSAVPVCANPGSEISLVPRDWLNGPVFSPKKQLAIREVAVNKNLWRMGIPNPLTNEPSTQIDMTHVRVLLGVLISGKGQPDVNVYSRAGQTGPAIRTCLRMPGVWWWDERASLSERSDGGAVGVD